MVRIPKPIQRVIEDYIKKINSQIPVDKAILFGSYAKNAYDLEPLPFTLSDYYEPLGIVEEIVKTGIEISIPA